MRIKQVKQFFEDKKDSACPLTIKLIQAGYQQESGGYIKFAYDQKVEVNFRKAEPNQWWHLIESYCNRTDEDATFGKNIQCGELIFWMAEVSDCIKKEKLEQLLEKIISSGLPIKRRNDNKPNVEYDRNKWNKQIQDLCFNAIVEKVKSMTL